MRKRLREGALDDKEIEIEVAEAKPPLEIMGPAGMEEMTEQLRGMFANLGGGQAQDAQDEDRRGDEAAGRRGGRQARQRGRDHARSALANAEQNGIVFIDEIDKVASRSETQGADVSRQGVQRDLLPLVEGTTVNTKYGMVKTDHILFIASGAFHLAKPSDLIPELQGRFPIRVELRLAVGRRLRGDPDADACQPGQAVPGAAGDRRRDAASSRPTASAAWRRSPTTSTSAPRTSARGACRR